MKISEAFLVDTKIFDSAIEALVNMKKPVPVINSSLLERMGYIDLSARLLVKILQELEIITKDGNPGELFDEFSNPATTKIALAKGLVHAYESIFEKDSSIHHKTPREINEEFNKIFSGAKNELIIKHISGTFVKIASFCGTSVVDDVLKQLAPQTVAHYELNGQEVNGQAISYAEKNTNGFHKDKSFDKVENFSRIIEEIGSKSIDDIITSFDDSRNNNLDNEYFEEEVTKDDMNNKNSADRFTDDPFNLEGSTDADQVSKAINKSTEVNSAKETGITEVNNSSGFASSESSDKNTELIQKAVFQRAELYFKLQRWEDLLPALNQIVTKYEQSDNAKIADVVSRSVIRRAKALFKLKQFDKALPALNAIIDRLKDSEVKEFYHQASLAMLYKVQLIENNNSNDVKEDLLPLYNSIINRLDNHSDPSIRDKVDDIHFKRFDILMKGNEKQDILKSSTQLVNRFRNRTANPEYLKLAMIKRAEVLEEMNRDEEALEAYEEFLRIFG